jgi:putative membrane protein
MSLEKKSDVYYAIGVIAFLFIFMGILGIAREIYAAPGSGSDAQFAMKAAQGGLTEVQFGQLAESKGTSDAVKEFGKRMVNDHSKAGEQLKQVAQQENLNLPMEMSKTDKGSYERLSKLSGAEFDREYAKMMVRDHEKDVAEFQKESQDGKDELMKNFAAQTLPTLQEHLQLAKQVEKSTMNASNSSM